MRLLVGVAFSGACQWGDTSPTTSPGLPTPNSEFLPPVSPPSSPCDPPASTPTTSAAIDWRVLDTGNYGHTHDDESPPGPEQCGDFEAVLLTDQAMADAWIVSVDDVDWSTDVVVGASAACSTLGHTICITETSDNADGDLALTYAVVTQGDVLDHESILYHAAAFEDGGWESVIASVTFVYLPETY
jgi:hypothetical protein